MRSRMAFSLGRLTVLAFLLAATSIGAHGQAAPPTETPHDTGPAAGLADALAAACRADDAQFAKSLTADNGAAFGKLSPEQRARLLERFSLSSEAGKALRSSDQNGHTVLRCESPGGVAEFRFAEARLRENLAFVSVTVVDGASANFGLVREGGSWKLLSLGLLLLDVPELSAQWSEQEMTEKEDAALRDLQTIADAVMRYRNAFGYLPDTLVQLGPGPTDQITPDLASLVSALLAAGDSDGYSFRYRMISPPDAGDPRFEVMATPDDYGKSGRRSFFRDAEGNVHSSDKKGVPASPDDPTLPADKTQP
jgi:hypothetical protein